MECNLCFGLCLFLECHREKNTEGFLSLPTAGEKGGLDPTKSFSCIVGKAPKCLPCCWQLGSVHMQLIEISLEFSFSSQTE